MAQQCNTQDDVKLLHCELVKAFQELNTFKNLDNYNLNDEFFVEDDGRPFISLNFANLLSDTFAIETKFIIRDAKFESFVSFVEFKDNMGRYSKNWDYKDEETIDFDGQDDTLLTTFQKTINVAQVMQAKFVGKGLTEAWEQV